MRRLVSLIVSLMSFAGVGAVAVAQTAAVVNTSVVDVATGRVQRDQTVLIEGGRIRAVVAARRASVPASATVVDGKGKFVIPGLWDMHVHATGPGLDRFFLPLLVANGVTGVRDMFGRLAWYDSARALSMRGEVVPRVYGAGHILDGFPAIWPGSLGVRNADEATRAVDSLAAAGAPFIKVYSRLSPESFRAAVAAGKAHKIPFAGHVPTLVSVEEAVSLGMLTIEHLQLFTTACSSKEVEIRDEISRTVNTKGWDSAGVVQRGLSASLADSYDRDRCRALAKRIAKSNTWMVPTTVVLRSIAFLDDTALQRDPRLKYMPKFFSASWDPRTDFRFRAYTPQTWLTAKRHYEHQREIIRMLHDEGAKFLAGTDLSNPWIFPGFSLHDELEHFVSNGFTPLQALQTATLNPAKFLAATDSMGTVAAGKVADLVVLDGNPLSDIRNVGRIHAVVVRGAVVDSAKRVALLAKGEAFARGQ